MKTCIYNTCSCKCYLVEMFKQVDLLGEPYIYSIVSMYLLYQNMMIYAYIMINWNL